MADVPSTTAQPVIDPLLNSGAVAAAPFSSQGDANAAPAVTGAGAASFVPAAAVDGLAAGQTVSGAGVDTQQPKRTVEEEALLPATALVALKGCESLHSIILSSVPRQHPLTVISVPHDFLLPRKKKKRVSYEGYEPEGVIKRGWVHKHRRKVPGVVVLFIEVGRRDQAALELDVQTRVMQFRADNAARATRLLVVLCKEGSGSNDKQVLESVVRAARKTGLEAAGNTRGVLWFNTAPHAQSTSIRALEVGMWDLACAYCKMHSRRTVSLRNKVQKSSQARLLARHQFKSAWFAEAGCDHSSALKHYRSAYQSLQHVQCAGDSAAMHEVKAVAHLLGFKVWSLHLQRGKLQDAARHFEQHVALYRRAQGVSAAAHSAWLSNQYSSMAGLLEACPAAQKITSRQFNPGYHLQTAATFTLQRKQAARAELQERRQLTQSGGMPALPSPRDLEPPQFFGQPAHLRGGGDARGLRQTRQQVVDGVLACEAVVDHSALLLQQLSKAYESFKRTKAKRMIVHVASQMAEEYCATEHWEMAKKFYDSIAHTYRAEGWWAILTQVVSKALLCAQRMNAPPQAMAAYILELLADRAATTPERKVALQKQLMQIRSSGGAVEKEEDKEVGIDSRLGLFDCDAHLATSTGNLHVHEPLELQVSMTSRLPLPVRPARVQLRFNHSAYDVALLPTHPHPNSQQTGHRNSDADSAPADSTGPGSRPLRPEGGVCRASGLKFASGHTRTFRLRLTAVQSTAGLPPLRLTHCVLLLGGQEDGTNCLRLRFDVTARNPAVWEPTDPSLRLGALSPVHRGFAFDEDGSCVPAAQLQLGPAAEEHALVDETQPEPSPQQQQAGGATGPAAAAEDAPFQVLSSVLRILPQRPKAYFDVLQTPPALVGELYPLHLTVHSDGDMVREGTLEISCGDGASSPSSADIADNDAAAGTSKAGAQPAAADAGLVRFYTLRQDSGGGNDDNDEGVQEVTGPLPLPALGPHESHELVVLVRAHQAEEVTVHGTITYQNKAKCALTYKGSFPLPFVHPLRLRLRGFAQANAPSPSMLALSDAKDLEADSGKKRGSSSSVTGSTSASPSKPRQPTRRQAAPLALNKPCIVYVQLNNNTPHRLRLTSLGLTLDRTAFRFASSVSPDSSGAGDDDTTLTRRVGLALGPGERYHEAFALVPLREGAALSPGSVCVDWSRCSGERPRLYSSSREANNASCDSASSKVRQRAYSVARQRRSSTGAVKVSGGGDMGGAAAAAAAAAGVVGGNLLEEDMLGAIADPAQREEARERLREREREQKRKRARAELSKQQRVEEGDTGVDYWTDDEHSVESTLILPTLAVTDSPVQVELSHPSSCAADGWLDVKVTLKNRSEESHVVLVTAYSPAPPAKMVFSGTLKGEIRLFPRGKHTLSYRVTPLDCGIIQLPLISLLSPTLGTLLNPAEIGTVFARPLALHQ